MNDREKTAAHLQCLDSRYAFARLALGTLQGDLQLFVSQIRGPAAPLHSDAQAMFDDMDTMRDELRQLHEKARAMVARAGEEDGAS